MKPISDAVQQTLNPITLFALIFSTGILVDDAIVVVESVVAIAASLRTD